MSDPSIPDSIFSLAAGVVPALRMNAWRIIRDSAGIVRLTLFEILPSTEEGAAPGLRPAGAFVLTQQEFAFFRDSISKTIEAWRELDRGVEDAPERASFN